MTRVLLGAIVRDAFVIGLLNDEGGAVPGGWELKELKEEEKEEEGLFVLGKNRDADSERPGDLLILFLAGETEVGALVLFLLFLLLLLLLFLVTLVILVLPPTTEPPPIDPAAGDTITSALAPDSGEVVAVDIDVDVLDRLVDIVEYDEDEVREGGNLNLG